MTFLDTNILVDIVQDQPGDAARWSRVMFEELAGEEQLVTNLIVAAELSAQLAAAEALSRTLARIEVGLVDMDLPCAIRAGAAFLAYRKRGGPRGTILPDFLIAAHASTLGARFMTRDRRLASYFPELSFLTPETAP